MSVFNQVQVSKNARSTFDLSHEFKFSGNMGDLIPVLAEEVLPNDTWKIQSAQVIRTAPLVTPVMHRVKAYMHYFFVPNRLLWENFTSFISGGEDGLDASVHPFIKWAGNSTAVNQGIGSLGDYLGLPQDQGLGSGDINVNALPFAAYQFIYNEYYRDQNLIPEKDYKLEDGDNTSVGSGSLFQLRKRAWGHDYFTSALPFVQKGVEATIPLGENAPLTFYGTNEGNPLNALTLVRDQAGNEVDSGTAITVQHIDNYVRSSAANPALLDVTQHTLVDLANATAYSINDLRRSMQLQKWLERNARAGSRYTEYLLAHWNKKSSDARLQRPEYIGGGSTPIQFSEVLQTSSTDDTTPQANMAGHGLSAGQSGNVNYNCEEHGWIIGIMSVVPNTNYMQGIPRKFSRVDKFDYPTPLFANIGEQAIQNKELYYDSSLSNLEDEFGYVPRYVEAKYCPNRIAGEFRTSLKEWHMARDFDAQPNLNNAFVNANPTRRIFAVTDDDVDTLYVNVYFDIKAKKTLPYFGTPI